SDIRRAIPAAAVDWVVEENFSAIPAAHDGVRRVLPVAVRRWRTSMLQARVRGEIRAFAAALRSEAYDAVIDTQGLLKSALIARAARGVRYGLDWRSSREPLAILYDRAFRVPWSQHAVERNRALAAKALSYGVPAGVDYGMHVARANREWLPQGGYAVLIHSTSASRKLWPESRWHEIGHYFGRHNVRCVFPWGDVAERERSERLAHATQGIVAPGLSVREVMPLLAGAYAVVGVDTGLTHLAAALGVPTIGIYCATDPARTGLHGCKRAQNVGVPGAMPATDEVIGAIERLAP
ncbi:MAG: lipopolysaccharide heptosyltransferase I, partial [Betaproteobacteria bacterium]